MAFGERASGESVEEDAVDPVVIEQLRELGGPEDPGFLPSLVTEFLEHSVRSLEEMRAAVLALDAHRLADLAHAMKGSAGNLGARRLATKAAEIERAGKAGEPTAARDLVEEAAVELERVRSRLVAETAKGSA